MNCKTSDRLTVLESNDPIVNAVQNPLEVQIQNVPITVPVEPIVQTAQEPRRSGRVVKQTQFFGYENKKAS